MNRRQIRDSVFRMLFRFEFHEKEEYPEQYEYFERELFEKLADKSQPIKSIRPEDLAYVNQKSSDVLEHLGEIDAVINEKANGWKTSRIGKAELAILRLAVYEILYEEDIPYKISVNEAIELAKKYVSEDAASFVNGVLSGLDE